MPQGPRHQRLRSIPDFLFFEKLSSFKNVGHKMQLADPTLTLDPSSSRSRSRSPSPAATDFGRDLTASLSDELLRRIICAVPGGCIAPFGLVCKRWLRIVDGLRRSLTLLDWSFLDGPSRRLTSRFCNLAEVDLVPAAFLPLPCASPIVLTRGPYSLQLDPAADHNAGEVQFIDSEAINRGLNVLGRGCPGLQRLCTVAPLDSEEGLATAAIECPTLQELEFHRCSDTSLRPISAFRNLQIVRLVASLEGLYSGPGLSDIGLTILAHGCSRLVKLELGCCSASFDGISAVGRCCPMLEELTICDDRRMEGGWLAALSYCGNLKTLKLQSCRKIDSLPGPLEHLGSCPAIERLLLHRCQLRDQKSLKALFMVCESVKEIEFQHCWGLEEDMFNITSICRFVGPNAPSLPHQSPPPSPQPRFFPSHPTFSPLASPHSPISTPALLLFAPSLSNVKRLALEGCSKITTEALESVILSWSDLQRLIVISCNNIKDDEVSPALSNLFSNLKEFKWRPDSKSVLSVNLHGTGIWKKGGKFFRKSRG
ncbi:F-box protein [Apostasia shenzhenica]|uniref:F-box protein n=1 Tax=Apostasia shenzhenica TaxID=1088818 RepID=A0A2I0AZY6_9ASPA|nr:F-box protein [Apostasia shenzhenica]